MPSAAASGAGEEEAARLDAGYDVDGLGGVALGEAVDCRSEGGVVASRGVMSLKRTPGLGKSGTSLMYVERSIGVLAGIILYQFVMTTP